MDRVSADAGGDTVAALHQALVDKLEDDGHICSSSVAAAFRAVPRHLFLPEVPVELVYRDEAIPTKFQDSVAISSSSQPAIMAIMLEQLGVKPGHRVLEIGTGTGYSTALLAHLVGEAGHVVSVDIEPDLVDAARDHLGVAGCDRVRLVCADGGFGYPEGAPYDRIILAVGAWEVVPAWREQLAPDGRIVLPLAIRFSQLSVAFESAGDHLSSVSVRGCGFMQLRGAFAAPRRDVPLGSEPGLTLTVDDPASVDAEATYRLLSGAYHDWPTGLDVSDLALGEGLSLWLGLHEPDLCQLFAHGEMANRAVVPHLFGYKDWWRSTIGLRRGDSLCVLLRPPPPEASADTRVDPTVALLVRQYGPDPELARQLIDRCRAWDAIGRPPLNELRIRAYPAEVEYIPAANDVVIPKRWTRLVFDWTEKADDFGQAAERTI